MLDTCRQTGKYVTDDTYDRVTFRVKRQKKNEEKKKSKLNGKTSERTEIIKHDKVRTHSRFVDDVCMKQYYTQNHIGYFGNEMVLASCWRISEKKFMSFQHTDTCTHEKRERECF